MGGQAFASGPHPLYTPRMPPEVYRTMKARCLRALREIYVCVASPIEGPAKEDFGDIDILVAVIQSKGETGMDSNPPKPHSSIQRALGATSVIVENNHLHFAVPWPVDLLTEEHPADKAPRFIQVDVEIASSVDRLQWTLFKHAHGDMWSLLGSIIRPYGLTIDEQSLWVRIPEVERSDKNKAKIKLTQEPAEVLSFLGLPRNGFWEAPFASRDDLFEYAAHCRMFHVTSDEELDASARGKDSDDGSMKLRTDDRRRLRTRPIFRAWFEEFKPRCRHEGRFTKQRTSRSQVRQEAFERFGVETEYQLRLTSFLREQQQLHVKKHVIKETFPHLPLDSATKAEMQYRGCLVKALTKIIMEGDTSFGVEPEAASPLKDAQGFYIIENVYDFMSRHHEEIGKAAMDRHQEAYRGKKE